MGAFEERCTRCLFFLVTHLPWFFSRRLKYLAGIYAKERNGSGRDVFEGGSVVAAASLFRGDVKWKGVSLIAAVGRSDLAKIHKWMSSQKSSPGNYHDSHKEGVFSTNLVGAGFSNLGVVSFERHNPFAVCTMSIAARLPSCCYLSLLRLKNGVSYLSIYIYFNEEVSEKVAQVDVSGVQGYKCLQSLNPFSPRFSVMVHHDRTNLIEEKIFENARDVVSQAREAAAALLDACGVKKSILDFATLADFFREGSGSYFHKEPRELFGSKNDLFAVVEPWRGMHICSKISDDDSEDYIERYISERMGVDAIFIKSQVSSLVDADGLYVGSFNSVTDYYSYMLMLAETYSRFKGCMKEVSPVFFKSNRSVRASLKILLKASLDLNLIDEKLGALEDGLHWCDKKYRNSARSRISGIRSQVLALRVDVEKRKALSDGELQLANLIWIRRYSILVFVMIFIQIAVSLLNVDWTDGGIGGNLIYKNLFGVGK